VKSLRADNHQVKIPLDELASFLLKQSSWKKYSRWST
jgi:hypothetical protein